MRWLCVGAAFALFGLTPAHAITNSYYATKSGAQSTAPVDTRVRPAAGSRLSGQALLFSSTSSCSGSAISATAILTAGHCGGSAQFASFSVFDNNGGLQSVVTRKVTSFTAAPGYSGLSNDIGVALLDTPLPSDVRTYALTSFTSANLLAGTGLTFAGYGINLAGNDRTYSDNRSGQTQLNPYNGSYYSLKDLRTGVNRVESVESSGRTFTTDFDSFGGSASYKQDEVGTSQGDSGSGVFFDSRTSFDLHCQLKPGGQLCPGSGNSPKLLSDIPIVVGITSFARSRGCGDNDYACWNRFGTEDGYTFVGKYVDWIRSVASDVTLLSIPDVYSVGTTGIYDLATGGFDVMGPGDMRITPAPMPEPSAWATMILGMAGLGAFLRFRRARRREQTVSI